MTTIGVARSSQSSTTTTTTTTSPSSATTPLPSSTTSPVIQSSKPASESSDSVTENAAPAQSSSSSATPQPSDSGSPKPSNGLTIGLAVAIPIGVLGLAAAGLTFFWSRRKLKRAANAGAQVTAINRMEQHGPPRNDGPLMPGYANAYNMYPHHYKTPEPGLTVAEAWVPPAELPGVTCGHPAAWELPGGNRY
jgi:hypothetical protein